MAEVREPLYGTPAYYVEQHKHPAHKLERMKHLLDRFQFGDDGAKLLKEVDALYAPIATANELSKEFIGKPVNSETIALRATHHKAITEARAKVFVNANKIDQLSIHFFSLIDRHATPVTVKCPILPECHAIIIPVNYDGLKTSFLLSKQELSNDDQEAIVTDLKVTIPRFLHIKSDKFYICTSDSIVSFFGTNLIKDPIQIGFVPDDECSVKSNCNEPTQAICKKFEVSDQVIVDLQAPDLVDAFFKL